MKRFSILALVAFAGLCFNLPVAAQSRIATVDLKRIFDGYWRTKQADANLKDQAAEMDKDRKGFVDDYTKARQDYQKLLDSTADAAISAEERDKRKVTAEKKLVEIRELEQTIQQYDRQATTTLQEKKRRMRDNILKDIREVVNSKAKAGGYTLALDTASETIANTPVVLFTTGDGDLTDAVLTQLNTTAPPDLPKTDEKPVEPKAEGKK